MDYLSIFIVSFTIALSGALMPGPLLTAVISESMKHGQKTGPLVILGHAILEVIMVAVILLAFYHYAYNFMVLKVVALLGGFILVYTGARMMLTVRSLVLEFKAESPATHSLIFTGITMSLANPYWTMWWLTVGLGLVMAAQRAGWAAIGIFFLGHIAADFGWYSIISFMVSRGRNYLSQSVYRGIVVACGVILVTFGLYFGGSTLY
jgi:threonine/homoserine/homoserine lactone efflux protein